jgi:hypothetical protein
MKQYGHLGMQILQGACIYCGFPQGISPIKLFNYRGKTPDESRKWLFEEVYEK